LAVSPHLWASIASALEESDYLILLASPDSAASPWVNREIEHWIAHKSRDHILPVLTEGELSWADDARDYDSTSSTALPPALVGVFADEPRHLDLRWARDQSDLDLRHPRFRDAVAELAAPMHGIAKEDLESEDVRRQRRALRLARGAVATLALLLVAAVISAGLAVRNAGRARDASHRAIREAQLERAHRLAAQAVNLTNGQYHRALLLAVEARRLDDSVDTRNALLTVLERSPRLEGFLPGASDGNIAATGLSRDGSTLAIAGFDGSVRVLDFPHRKTLRSIATGHRKPIRAVALSTDGRTLATGADDGAIRLFDTRNGRSRGRPINLVTHGSGSVTEAAFSPDGHFLAAITIAAADELVLWDVRRGVTKARIRITANGAKQTVTFSNDGSRLAVAGAPPQVFDMQTMTPTTYPTPGFARSVAFSPDGLVLAVGYADRVEFHDVLTGREVRPTLPAAAQAIAFSPDGSVVVTSQLDGTVTVWDETGRPSGPPLIGHSLVADYLAFVPDSSLVVSASKREVAVWDLRQAATIAQTLQADPALPSWVQRVRFSPDGQLLAAPEISGNVVLWDTATGKPIGQPIAAHPHPIQTDLGKGNDVGTSDVAFSPDGRALATVGWGETVSLWDVATHRRLRPALPVPKSPGGIAVCLCTVAFSPDGRMLAAGADDGTIALIDVSTWTVRRRLPAHRPGFENGNSSLQFAFRPDGSSLASSAQGSVVVDDLASNDRRVLVTPAAIDPGQLAFSQDGSRLVVGGEEAQVFDTTTWKTIHAVGGASRSDLGSIAVRGDGSLLATGTYGSASLWDTATGEPLGEPLETGSGIQTLGLAFSPDGSRLATGDYGGRVLLWDIRPDAWTVRACALAGDNLTESEWVQYLPESSFHATCATP
jgi:WD40 repeat protein